MDWKKNKHKNPLNNEYLLFTIIVEPRDRFLSSFSQFMETNKGSVPGYC